MSEGIKTEGKEVWIFWLKAIACVLITNSHCRNIYPYSFLAVGGGFGNGLFFTISGYLSSKVDGSFWKWYGKKVKRVLPPVILVTFIDFLVCCLRDGIYFREVFQYLFKYWFVNAWLIYNVVWFFLFRKNKRLIYRIIMLWVTGYVLIYIYIYI